MRHSKATTGLGFTATMLIAFLVGCAQTVIVPREELMGCRECTGLYRIQTSDDQFMVQRFTASDSAITILEFAEADGRRGTTETPVILPLGEVESVVRLSSDRDYTSLIVLCTFVVVAAVYLAVTIPSAFPATD